MRASWPTLVLVAVGVAPPAIVCKEVWEPPTLTTQTAEAGGVKVHRCCGGAPLHCAVHVTAPDGSTWSARAPVTSSFVFPLSATVVATGDAVVTPRGPLDLRGGFSASEWEDVERASACGVRPRLVGLSGGRLRLRLGHRAVEVDEAGAFVRPGPTHAVCSPDLVARWATLDPRGQLVALSQAIDGLELEGEPASANEAERACVDVLLTAANEGTPEQRVAATEALALFSLRGPRTGLGLLGRVGVLTPLGRDLREVLAARQAWYDAAAWAAVGLALAGTLTITARRRRVGGALVLVSVGLLGQRLWAHRAEATFPLDVDDVRAALFRDAAGRLTRRLEHECDGAPVALRRTDDVLAALAPLQPRLAQCAQADGPLQLEVQPDGSARVRGASWSFDAACVTNVLDALVLPPAALPLEVVVAVRAPQVRDAGVVTTPPAPPDAPAPEAQPRWLTEPRVVAVREQVKAIDEAAAGVVPLVEQGCTFTAERQRTGELGSGSWERLTRSLLATPSGTRVTFESTWATFNDPDVDGAGSSRREVYRDAREAPLFVFETVTPTAGAAPTKVEVRTWFDRGQPFVQQAREGPALPAPGALGGASWREARASPQLDWADVSRDARVCDALPDLVRRAIAGDAAATSALASAFPHAFSR
jgi:hypothetical protein